MKSKELIERLKHQPLDETKPGLGQFYCITCSRYFDSVSAKNTHIKGRHHKRRIKELKEGPYTQEEAVFAAGHNVQLFLKKKEERKMHINSEIIQNEMKDINEKETQSKNNSLNYNMDTDN